jgi:uncharacterized protein YcfL
MGKLQMALSCETISRGVLLTLLLTGCSSNNAQFFSNVPDSSKKMKHQTIILNAETHQPVKSSAENLSEVRFEYELINTQ